MRLFGKLRADNSRQGDQITEEWYNHICVLKRKQNVGTLNFKKNLRELEEFIFPPNGRKLSFISQRLKKSGRLNIRRL